MTGKAGLGGSRFDSKRLKDLQWTPADGRLNAHFGQRWLQQTAQPQKQHDLFIQQRFMGEDRDQNPRRPCTTQGVAAKLEDMTLP